MTRETERLNNDDLALAVVGLMTAAIVAIFVEDGEFSLFLAPVGMAIFLIGQSFSPRLVFDRFGFAAFCIIQGAAALCLSGFFVARLFHVMFHEDFAVWETLKASELWHICFWLSFSSLYAYYRWKKMGGFR